MLRLRSDQPGFGRALVLRWCGRMLWGMAGVGVVGWLGMVGMVAGAPEGGATATNSAAGVPAPVSTASTVSGTNKALVYVVEGRGAMVAYEPQLEVLKSMVRRGLSQVTGKSDLREAWGGLLGPKDVVGIKVHSGAGFAGTRVSVVEAVVDSLLSAGVERGRIVIWDRLTADLDSAGFTALGKRLGVEVASCQAYGYDESVAYTNFVIGKLLWTDHEFNKDGEEVGKRSFFSKLLTQRLNRIVTIAPMLNHYRSGVSGCLYSLAFGAVDNTQRFEVSVDRLSEAVPEIYAQEPIVDRVVLNIVDALMVQYQGETQPLLHYSKNLNQLRFSKDPVALDVLSLMELDQLRRLGGIELGTNYFRLYTENAALLQLGVGDTNRIEVLRSTP